MFNLYTTSHCHLCELALQLALKHISPELINLIEIANSNELIELYGTRIPVLTHTDSFAELSWPFNEADLQHFINTANKKTSI